MSCVSPHTAAMADAYASQLSGASGELFMRCSGLATSAGAVAIVLPLLLAALHLFVKN